MSVAIGEDGETTGEVDGGSYGRRGLAKGEEETILRCMGLRALRAAPASWSNQRLTKANQKSLIAPASWLNQRLTKLALLLSVG